MKYIHHVTHGAYLYILFVEINIYLQNVALYVQMFTKHYKKYQSVKLIMILKSKSRDKILRQEMVFIKLKYNRNVKSRSIKIVTFQVSQIMFFDADF